MSQQTTLAVVVPRFLLFMKMLPDVRALAHCDDATLRSLWSGLGYYARARNLQNGARVLVESHGGVLPSTYDEWRKVPGCGPYTAAMISSVAFDVRAAAVDGNIARVLSRLHCLGEKTWTPAGARFMQREADALIADAESPGCHNQALMELGALVCRKRQPNCGRCPISASCEAFRRGETALHPPDKPRRAPQETLLTALVLCDGNERRVALVDRSEGFLSGTRGFPLRAGAGEDHLQLGQAAPRIRHVITCHRITLTPIVILVDLAECGTAESRVRVLARFGIDVGILHWCPLSEIEGSLATSLDRKVWKSVKTMT